MVTSLFVKRVCPVHLVEEFATVFLIIGIMAVLLTFYRGYGEYDFGTVRVGFILRNGCGIEVRNFLELLR